MEVLTAARMLRSERTITIFGLLAVILAAWTYLLSGAGTLEDMGGMLMPMSSGPWTVWHALVMFAMWSVMMAAMMLPSAVPMILLYAAIARGRIARGERTVAPTAVFALGYLVVWGAFSAIATMLQYWLEQLALLSAMMEMTSVVLAGAILIAAGVYQWTPLKQSCLVRCRSPLDFVFSHWRSGTRGAFSMGLRHGLFCVGCCWMLMLLLFVGGIMNLAWIAGLALFVLVEKLAPAGGWVSRAGGVLLIVWGVATLSTMA